MPTMTKLSTRSRRNASPRTHRKRTPDRASVSPPRCAHDADANDRAAHDAPNARTHAQRTSKSRLDRTEERHPIAKLEEMQAQLQQLTARAREEKTAREALEHIVNAQEEELKRLDPHYAWSDRHENSGQSPEPRDGVKFEIVGLREAIRDAKIPNQEVAFQAAARFLHGEHVHDAGEVVNLVSARLCGAIRDALERTGETLTEADAHRLHKTLAQRQTMYEWEQKPLLGKASILVDVWRGTSNLTKDIATLAKEGVAGRKAFRELAGGSLA